VSSQEDLDEQARLEVELINVKAANAKKLLRIESEKQTIIKKLNAETNAEIIAYKKEQAEDIATIEEESSNDIIEIDTSAVDEYKRLINEKKKADEEYAANKKAQEEAIAEQTKKNIEDERQMAIDASIEVGNFLFDQKRSQLQREFDAAEGNAKKQAEISRKIAQNEKKQALFNVAINTAVAVSKVWGQTGIFGLAAQIPVLIMGALQAGLIAAQPIPQFATGTNYAPGGMSIVGEKGRELIINPTGKISLAENPALVNLERGAKVIPNSKTEAILNDRNIVGELKLTRKAIQRMPRARTESRFNSRQKGFREGYLAAKHRLN